MQLIPSMAALAATYNGRPSPTPTRPSTTAALSCVMAWAVAAGTPAALGRTPASQAGGTAASVLQNFGLSPLLLPSGPGCQPGWAHDACVCVLAGTMLMMEPTCSEASGLVLPDWSRLAGRLLDAALAEAAAAAGCGKAGGPGAPSSSSGSNSSHQQPTLRLVHHYGLPLRVLTVRVIVCGLGGGMGATRCELISVGHRWVGRAMANEYNKLIIHKYIYNISINQPI